jgi:hypothetical protein
VQGESSQGRSPIQGITVKEDNAVGVQAITRLQEMWQQLEFFVVERTVAREPKDVLAIDLQKPMGRFWPNGVPMYNGIEQATDRMRKWKRLRQVPARDRARAVILWKRFHGFTTEGIRFDMDGYNELNLTGGLEPPLGFEGGRTFCDLPAEGQLICGIVEDTPKGRRLSRWFACDEAFKLLVRIIRQGTTTYSEQELGRLLLTDGYPDRYWAIARLVGFDNVQAFIDCIKMGSVAPIRATPSDFGRHPAFGEPYGRYRMQVDWRGMYIGDPGFAAFVHQLSSILDPRWWEDFLRRASRQSVVNFHLARHDTCYACLAPQQMDKSSRSRDPNAHDERPRHQQPRHNPSAPRLWESALWINGRWGYSRRLAWRLAWLVDALDLPAGMLWMTGFSWIPPGLLGMLSGIVSLLWAVTGDWPVVFVSERLRARVQPDRPPHHACVPRPFGRAVAGRLILFFLAEWGIVGGTLILVRH